MKDLLYALAALFLFSLTAHAEGRPPCPCNTPCDPLMNFEIATGGQPHYILSDGTTLTEVNGETAPVIVKNAGVNLGGLPLSFQVKTEKSVRFHTSNEGTCVGIKGTKGFEDPKGTVTIHARSGVPVHPEMRVSNVLARQNGTWKIRGLPNPS